MSTMSMSGKGCMAIRGEEKDGTEEEGIFVAGGRTYGFGNLRYCKRSSRTKNYLGN